MYKLWTNKTVLPTKARKARTLFLAFPLFKEGVLALNTQVGYKKTDRTNAFDGIHSRILYFQILGFGLILQTKWDSNGRFD